jgi:hypothetical protein
MAIGVSPKYWLGALLAATVVAVSPAAAAVTRVGGIDVQTLADAFASSPVALAGHPDPTLSTVQRRALSARIVKLDPGRIRIAVVSPVSFQATGDLAQALSSAIGSDGVVIVVAGSNYHVTTTWGSGESARVRLAAAVERPGDSLSVQLQRAIDSFASADATLGHPGSDSSESSGSGGGGGVIVGVIALGVVLATAAAFGGRRLRRTLRASHRRREETADVQDQAQADLITLGEQIGALDVDSSMPNASAVGKDEYAKSLECYQDAERRLRHSDDDYQFERALDALKRGLEHVRAAEQLFNAPTSRSDVVDELSRLGELHDRGALTDAEFEQEKRRLLAE